MVSKFTLEGKKYVIMPKEEYEALKLAAELNSGRKGLLEIDKAEAYSLELIKKLAKENHNSA